YKTQLSSCFFHLYFQAQTVQPLYHRFLLLPQHSNLPTQLHCPFLFMHLSFLLSAHTSLLSHFLHVGWSTYIPIPVLSQYLYVLPSSLPSSMYHSFVPPVQLILPIHYLRKQLHLSDTVHLFTPFLVNRLLLSHH